MRKKIAAGNWKMNTTPAEALQLTTEIANMATDEVLSDVQIVLAPPYIHLLVIGKYIEPYKNIALAAQNCSNKASGAYTGEVSAPMLAASGVKYVILGHSERRMHFGESPALLNEKVNVALENKLTPIFCCGESLEQREAGGYLDFVCNQLSESLSGLDTNSFSQLVIAYEPVWAIGTGKTATSEQAQEMHAAIRTHLGAIFGADVLAGTSILYGGSVNGGNAAELFACPDVDGGLVGGASLKSREFVNIVKVL